MILEFVLSSIVLNAPVCEGNICVPPTVTQGVEVKAVAEREWRVAKAVRHVLSAPVRLLRCGHERRAERRHNRGGIFHRRRH